MTAKHVNPPNVCADCLLELFRSIGPFESGVRFKYCPHGSTLLRVGFEAARAVVWQMSAPCTAAEAAERIEEHHRHFALVAQLMAEESGPAN
jgi:hypothetical protein